MQGDPYHYKSKFVIAVLAIFVILLAYGYLSAQNIVNIPFNSGTNQQATHDESERIFNEAVFSSDITKCDQLSGVQKNNCIYAIVSRQLFFWTPLS